MSPTYSSELRLLLFLLILATQLLIDVNAPTCPSSTIVPGAASDTSNTYCFSQTFFFVCVWNDAQRGDGLKARTAPHLGNIRPRSLLPAMSLEESVALYPENSRTLNGSGVTRDPAGDPQRYNIWLPGVGIAAVYGVIIAVGLVGNVTLMKTCLTVKSLRTVPNLFLSSLALGDLLLLVTCAPVDASRYLADEWLFGRVGCKLIPFIQLTSVGVSVFTLTALSADR